MCNIWMGYIALGYMCAVFLDAGFYWIRYYFVSFILYIVWCKGVLFFVCRYYQ